LAIDCIISVVSFGILLQFFHYRKSMNIYQGFSAFVAVVCSSFLLLFLYVLYYCVKSRLKIVVLDVVDTLWLISTCAHTFKLVPQVWINFLARCTVGLDSLFLPLQMITVLFMSYSLVSVSNWWEAPVNLPPSGSLLVYLGTVLMLAVQGYIYKSTKPVATLYQEV
jgi:glucan phosphoethanolaminetransferase (alkaline phosphatase superfamily)